MTKHEIHLRFMEAVLSGAAIKMYGSAIPEQDIMHKACRLADNALEAYIACWPDVKFEN